MAVDWVNATDDVWTCKACDVLVCGAPPSLMCGCGATLTLLTPLLETEEAEGVFAKTRWILPITYIVLLLIDPWHAAWIRPVLFILQLAGLAGIVYTIRNSVGIRALIRDRRTRGVHGLEHATATLLEQRGIVVGSGCSFVDSFVLVIDHGGRLHDRISEVKATVIEAIARIRQGEHALAYHPRCGTSRLVATLLLSTTVVMVWLTALIFRLPLAYVASGTLVMLVAAYRLMTPLGLLAQRAFTVSVDLASAHVKGVHATMRGLSDMMLGQRQVELIVMVDVVPRGVGDGGVPISVGSWL